MKQLLTFFASLLMVLSFTACSSDDDDDNNSELSTMIVGKWRITKVEQKDGSMYDVTTYLGEKVFEPTYATFLQNGEYIGTGAFGTGMGTYKVRGNKIHTYIDEDEYFVYTVESYTATKATVVISIDGASSTLRVEVEKQ